MIRLIAALDDKRGIGKNGLIPWKIPEDEQYFTDQTKLYGGNVLTGGRTFRLTYHGPLKDRQNFIVTHETEPIEGAVVVNDIAKFLEEFKGKDLWVAGGAAVFQEVMALGYADELYLTHIEADFDCDRFFPPYEKDFKLAEQSEEHQQNNLRFRYARYAKKA
jgi:dihydrofolate reductase